MRLADMNVLSAAQDALGRALLEGDQVLFAVASELRQGVVRTISANGQRVWIGAHYGSKPQRIQRSARHVIFVEPPRSL